MPRWAAILALALLATACKDSAGSDSNPVPLLEGISPGEGNAGSTNFTFLVLGDNFVGSSIVRWNGTDLSTEYVGRTQLKATVPTALLATPGQYPVRVYNPAPGGGISGAINFVLK